MGIVSSNPGVIGNSSLRGKNNTVLVGLVGQVAYNPEQVNLVNGFAYTKDEVPLGMILSTGKVYINISSVDGEHGRQIAALKRENRNIKNTNIEIQAENRRIKEQLSEIKFLMCSMNPNAKLCKNK